VDAFVIAGFKNRSPGRLMTDLDRSQTGPANPSILGRLIAVAVPLLLYFTLAGKSRLLNDADTFWHIAVGELTLESGLITHDHFSFTRDGEPWIANQWLAECILAVADAIGGLDGVLVLTVTILTATYLGLAHRWLGRGFDPLLTLAFTALIISTSAYTINARPHIISIGFLACVFVLLRDVEDGQKPTARLLLLIPLFVLWSNLHGGVLGGVGTLALVSAAWTAQWVLGATTPLKTRRDAAVLLLNLSACTIALFITPYGAASLRAWLQIMSMSLPDLIIEHAPLHPGTPQGALVILLCVIYTAIFAATPQAWRQPTFWLPLVWFLLTCQRIRHAPLFAVVAGIAMADLLPRSRLAPWFARRKWLMPHREHRCGAAALQIAAVTVVMTTPLFLAAVWLKHVGPLPIVGAQWVRPTSRVWPEELLPALAAYANAQPDGTPIFNEPILGGYLIKNFPSLRVFIDGRCELYGEPFLNDFVTAWRDPSHVGKWQEQFAFRAALIEAKSPLRTYFDNDDRWRQSAKSPAVLFYRMQPDYGTDFSPTGSEDRD
jgi:hypothetical protein